MRSRLFAGSALLVLGGFLGSVLFAPGEPSRAAAAAGSIVRVWQVVHPYADLEHDGTPDPLDCIDDTAPKRILSDVMVEASAPTVVPFTFEFGQIGTGRGGTDVYIWIQETRQVAVPAGVSQIGLIDQVRPAAGTFYFDARVEDQQSPRCVFRWT